MTAVIHSAALSPQRPQPANPYRAPWTNHEEKHLRQLYPTGAKEEICAAIPNRTWVSIHQHAHFLKISRLEAMPRNEHLHPVVCALIDRRVALGLKRAHVARLIGWNHRWQAAIERGTRVPTLPMLDQWAAALGLRIMAIPLAPCAIESATNQE